jgi:hypothetical protein
MIELFSHFWLSVGSRVSGPLRTEEGLDIQYVICDGRGGSNGERVGFWIMTESYMHFKHIFIDKAGIHALS